MTDEFGNETTAPEGQRVGYCQDCGKPLTAETVRPVGQGVFCEPCLIARVGVGGQAAAPPPPAMGAVPPVYGSVPPPTAGTHLPSPTLAGFLGLIPGVGAMYNGQFAKGIAHLVIFFVLSSLSDHVNGAFGILVAGWVFYQAFEAYHTAKARLMGDPLPNPLGLNDIGDRMGFGKSWPGSASRPPMTTPVTEWSPVTPPATAAPVVPPPAAPVPPVPPANWAGYVPPTAFAQAMTPPIASAPPQQSAGWGSVPYQAPGPQYAPVGHAGDLGTGLPTAVPPVPARQFPLAAVALIALGVLALLGTLFHMELSASWITAAALAVLAAWMFAHRVMQLRREHPEGLQGAELLTGVVRRTPVMLAVLAVLFALQAAHMYTLGQTWAVIVIAFGAMLLLERAAGRAVHPVYVDPRSPMTPVWATGTQTTSATGASTQNDAEMGGPR